MNKPQVLIVEDQARERDALARLLRTEGYEPLTAKNTTEAMALVSPNVAAVVSDLRLGQESGIDLLRFWKSQHPDTPFLIVTAYGEVDTAVGALKLGAEDYLQKPISPETLLLQLRELIGRRQYPHVPAVHAIDANPYLDRIVGKSSAIRELKEQIRRVAETDGLVLITGESGTGKELVAAAIHHLGKRAKSSFVAVNVAAVPESLVEAELFGSVKGAFTGADTNRRGRFEAANGGTLFIDEIGDFPLSSQAKLLRVLEDYVITPVGTNEGRKVDVRVVAATSRNLSEMIDQSQFRQDLFYRLNLLTIQIPALRQRADDIPVLIDQFLIESQTRHHRTNIQLSSELRAVLMKYDWPGNVRQLRNTIENMVVMGRKNPLSIEDLPVFFSGNPDASHSNIAAREGLLQEVERDAIQSALAKFDGNRTHAAEALGISVRTLQRKLKQWSSNG